MNQSSDYYGFLLTLLQKAGAWAHYCVFFLFCFFFLEWGGAGGGEGFWPQIAVGPFTLFDHSVCDYSRTSMAQTSFGPCKFVRDMGSSSH